MPSFAVNVLLSFLLYINETRMKQNKTNGAGHSNPRPVPHCRTLSSCEFEGMIPKSLPVYVERFMTTVVNKLSGNGVYNQMFSRLPGHILTKFQ